jgi:hypothetical protein
MEIYTYINMFIYMYIYRDKHIYIQVSKESKMCLNHIVSVIYIYERMNVNVGVKG